MRGRIVGFGERTKYYLGYPGCEKEVSSQEFHAKMEESQKIISEGLEDTVEVNLGRPWTKPIESDALAVHPKQIKTVMERNARHGLHINYDPTDGRPLLQDRDQRRRLMKIEGCHDNNGGYGDG